MNRNHYSDTQSSCPCARSGAAAKGGFSRVAPVRPPPRLTFCGHFSVMYELRVSRRRVVFDSTFRTRCGHSQYESCPWLRFPPSPGVWGQIWVYGVKLLTRPKWRWYCRVVNRPIYRVAQNTRDEGMYTLKDRELAGCLVAQQHSRWHLHGHLQCMVHR